MSNFGVGEIVYQLRKKIQGLQLELDELHGPSNIPELITSANLLRSNEYLTNVSKKQNELLSAYRQYSDALKDMIDVIFEIQNDLKDVLKEQTRLLADEKSHIPKKRTKSKTKKTSIKKR